MRYVFAAILVSLVGCSETADPGAKQKSLAEKAGHKVGESLTDFASGVGAGVDTQLAVPVELSAGVQAAGLSSTVSKSQGLESKGIAIYLIAKQPVTGNLIAKALNSKGDEIGRSKVEVKFEADDAKYVNFTFDKEMDTRLVTRYVIDMPKAAPVKP